jgi:hypothetical protein
VTDSKTTVTERPRSVVCFEWLMYLGLVGGIAFGGTHPEPTSETASEAEAVGYTVGIVAAPGLYALGIWSIARRRIGWVRWLFVGMLILLLPRFVRKTDIYYYTDPIAAVEYAFHYLATCGAMLLAFTTEARAWFRNKPAVDPAVFD